MCASSSIVPESYQNGAQNVWAHIDTSITPPARWISRAGKEKGKCYEISSRDFFRLYSILNLPTIQLYTNE